MENNHYRLLGLKFYRFKDDSDIPTVIRLTKVNEIENTYEFIDSDKNKVVLPYDEVMNQWIKLNPDGIVAFDCCSAIDNQGEEVPDVVVRLHRIDKQKDNINPVPYCICRQAVIDIFALLQTGKYIAGMCMSIDTCPPELDYSGMLKFIKSTYHVQVAVYIDDHLDDILSIFNNKKFDARLKLIKDRNKMDIDGYMDSLYELLQSNYFMLDFHKAFNIHEFDIKSFDFEDDNTNRVLTDYIITNLHEVPTKFYPMLYTKYIDLESIKRNYILICPDSFKYPNEHITLLVYDVHPTLSYKDLINNGRSPKDAKKDIMKQLGWS